jgi:hypothetical protein
MVVFVLVFLLVYWEAEIPDPNSGVERRGPVCCTMRA